MAPTHFERCAFKMPKNPKYECVREAKMFQSDFGVWHCSFHDTQAKDRCQAFLFTTYRGSGMQCVELAEYYDEVNELKYCADHVPEQVYYRNQTETPSNGAVKDVKAMPLEGKKNMSAFLDPKCENPVVEYTEAIHKVSGPDKTNDAEVKAKFAESLRLHRDSRDASSLDGSEAEYLIPNLMAFRSLLLQAEHEERQRISSMYVQCNICLEKHASSLMNTVGCCGHKFRELCLQKMLKRGNLRRYNCSSCSDWMARMREGGRNQLLI